mgnify:CR=1 FL=1
MSDGRDSSQAQCKFIGDYSDVKIMNPYKLRVALSQYNNMLPTVDVYYGAMTYVRVPRECVEIICLQNN